MAESSASPPSPPSPPSSPSSPSAEDRDRPTNPFEDDTAHYLVVVNDEDQHALWPASLTVPAGWRTVLDAASREDCLAYVQAHWTDLRPASVRDV